MHPDQYPVHVDQRGRLVLPAGVRQCLDIAHGGRLLLQLREDGTVVLRSSSGVVRGGKGLLQSMTAGRSRAQNLSEEIIAERHLAAERE